MQYSSSDSDDAIIMHQIGMVEFKSVLQHHKLGIPKVINGKNGKSCSSQEVNGTNKQGRRLLFLKNFPLPLMNLRTPTYEV